MFVQRFTVALATDGSGAQTAYTSDIVNGQILSVRYVVDGTNPLATGGSVTVTGETTGLPIIAISAIGTSSTQFYPRAATCDTSAAASLYAAAGQAVTDKITLSGERIKVVVASGGASKVGTLYFIIG